MVTGSYYDFSRLGTTFTNATNEIGSALNSGLPTWLQVIILVAILGAIILVIRKAAGFFTGMLDIKQLLGKKDK